MTKKVFISTVQTRSDIPLIVGGMSGSVVGNRVSYVASLIRKKILSVGVSGITIVRTLLAHFKIKMSLMVSSVSMKQKDYIILRIPKALFDITRINFFEKIVASVGMNLFLFSTLKSSISLLIQAIAVPSIVLSVILLDYTKIFGQPISFPMPFISAIETISGVQPLYNHDMKNLCEMDVQTLGQLDRIDI